MSTNLVDLAKRGLQNPSAILPFLKRKMIQKTWPIWESLGFHIVPNHFYYPIPDTNDLRQKQPWNKTYPTEGIDLREDKQLELLDEFSNYFSEYSLPTKQRGFLSTGDGAVLYSMVRKYKPDKIIEVGSGESTKASLTAATKNERESGSSTKITAIDPYPDKELKELAQKHNNLTLLTSRAEDISAEKYCQLENGDFLFIDSSHTLAVGNDVAHLYLNVLPQLSNGVYIHSHDIFFPSEYPKEWLLNKKRFWTEQYLLQSFLMFNNSFQVVWSFKHLKDKYRKELEKEIPHHKLHGVSFWMRRND